MNDWFQWTIVGFIVLSILFHVWKGGSANPVGTGSLGRRVAGLAAEVATLSGKVRHVESDMKELKRDAATTKDIAQLQELIDERLRSQKELSEATNRNVQRIYDIMLEKGLGRQ
jgi:outer membrane murein-binding lipoprotein Lpp